MPVEPRGTLGRRDRELLRRAGNVVGIDEVGRGALAGPVVVGGVVFDRVPNNPAIQDSKALTARQRQEAAAWVRANCLAWTVVEAWVEIIDRLNILEATRLAMRSVAGTLAAPDSVVIVDNVDIGAAGREVLAPKAADASFFCVAAASIVAKVHRDELMIELAKSHGQWQWERNKGYGTKGHRMALGAHGPTFLHRTTFGWSPVLP